MSLFTTLQIVDAMGVIVNDNVAMRTAFGVTLDGFQTLLALYGPVSYTHLTLPTILRV